MKADKKSLGSMVLFALAPMWLFAALVIVYGLSLSALSSSILSAKISALIPTVIGFAACVYLKVRKKLRAEHLTVLIFLTAIAIRVYYILATDWNERQHDVFVFDTQGHAGYIYTMMKTGRLPETNTGLFYHPPLHPYIMGLAGNLLSNAINTTEQVFEALQLLPAYYSLMCSFVFLKILDIFKIRQSTKLLFLAFFSLHPTLIIFSGSINNDVLCLLLSMCVLLYLLRFWQEQSLKNAVLMGLLLGLAMMTKVSAVTIAPVIAVVFVIRLVKPEQNKKRASVFVNELCFGAVSVPLGMWYPIRNLIKFNQPLGYVMPIGKAHPLYCGDKSLFERYFSLPIRQLFENPYCLPEEDYNIPIYTVKCSVFGEFAFDFPKWSAILLLTLNCMIILFCIFAAIHTAIKKEQKAMLLTAVSIVSVLFFLWFNFQYPNGCSMDFRYISICLPASIIPAVQCFDEMGKKGKTAVSCLLICFAALTACLYFSEKLF